MRPQSDRPARERMLQLTLRDRGLTETKPAPPV